MEVSNQESSNKEPRVVSSVSELSLNETATIENFVVIEVYAETRGEALIADKNVYGFVARGFPDEIWETLQPGDRFTAEIQLLKAKHRYVEINTLQINTFTSDPLMGPPYTVIFSSAEGREVFMLQSKNSSPFVSIVYTLPAAIKQNNEWLMDQVIGYIRKDLSQYRNNELESLQCFRFSHDHDSSMDSLHKAEEISTSLRQAIDTIKAMAANELERRNNNGENDRYFKTDFPSGKTLFSDRKGRYESTREAAIRLLSYEAGIDASSLISLGSRTFINNNTDNLGSMRRDVFYFHIPDGDWKSRVKSVYGGSSWARREQIRQYMNAVETLPERRGRYSSTRLFCTGDEIFEQLSVEGLTVQEAVKNDNPPPRVHRTPHPTTAPTTSSPPPTTTPTPAPVEAEEDGERWQKVPAKGSITTKSARPANTTAAPQQQRFVNGSPMICNYCKKPNHTEDRCFVKNPSKKPPATQK